MDIAKLLNRLKKILAWMITSAMTPRMPKLKTIVPSNQKVSIFPYYYPKKQGRRSQTHRIIGGNERRLGVWGRKSPSGIQGLSPGKGSGGRSPPEAEAFCETSHNICIKIQQTTVVAVIG